MPLVYILPTIYTCHSVLNNSNSAKATFYNVQISFAFWDYVKNLKDSWPIYLLHQNLVVLCPFIMQKFFFFSILCRAWHVWGRAWSNKWKSTSAHCQSTWPYCPCIYVNSTFFVWKKMMFSTRYEAFLIKHANPPVHGQSTSPEKLWKFDYGFKKYTTSFIKQISFLSDLSLSIKKQHILHDHVING